MKLARIIFFLIRKTGDGDGDHDDYDSTIILVKPATLQVSHVFPYVQGLCGTKRTLGPGQG